VGSGLSGPTARYGPGDWVRVLRVTRPGHLRTPSYVRGATGWVVRHQGDFPNPEELAYGHDGLPRRPLYLVGFRPAELWPGEQAAPNDELYIDIYEHWLRPVEEAHEH
jgi:hypothetical protein